MNDCFLIQAHKGVRGMVQDRSGKPIVGAMIVMNRGMRVYTAEGGYFHALLDPGSHDIEVVADGYQHQRQKVGVCTEALCKAVVKAEVKTVEVKSRTVLTGKRGWLSC